MKTLNKQLFERTALIIMFAIAMIAGCIDQQQPKTTSSSPEKTSAPVQQDPRLQEKNILELGLKLVSTQTETEILTDKEGFVVYYSKNDAPNKSNCNELCAKTWVPVKIMQNKTIEVEINGIKHTLSAINRNEDYLQATIDSVPIYYYIGDDKPLILNGNGIGKVWYTIDSETLTRFKINHEKLQNNRETGFGNGVNNVIVNNNDTNVKTNQYDEFAKCITEKGWKVFTLDTCPHCSNQKARFGTSIQYIEVIECRKNQSLCIQEGIVSVPTWKGPDGKTFVGDQPLQNLAGITGCSLTG